MIALRTVNTTDEDVLGVYEVRASLWAEFTPEAGLEVRNGNHERLVEEARTSVRAWEKKAKSDHR